MREIQDSIFFSFLVIVRERKGVYVRERQIVSVCVNERKSVCERERVCSPEIS